MCLLDNREVRKGWQPLKEAMLGLFQKHGAKILSGKRWDERRLAYSIKGQPRGTYLLIYFTADTQGLTALRRDLQFNESLLRYLLVDCDEVPQTAYEPEGDFDVNAIPADDAPSPAPEAAPEVEVSSTRGAGKEAADADDTTETTESTTEAGS
ncbi:MAG: 30S ribosomal protein S6 [Planctomycetes bacterium]|nr:30S ribosomal protein S6 [Planctomycetota bacterium]